MAELAKKIVVDLPRRKLLIDGEEFGWHITEDGVDVSDLNNRNELAKVSFTVLAETVEVIPEVTDG